MDKFKDYLQGLGKIEGRALTDHVISDYNARLRRVPKFLGIEPDSFFKIKGTKKLLEIMNQLKSHPEFEAATKGVQNDVLVAFRLYIKSLKPESFSSYASYLKRVPIILKINSDLFFKIDKPNKLISIKEELKSNKDFKKVVKKSQGNILTAFHRYIESIENLHNLKTFSKRYLKDLNLSYKDYIKKSLDKKKATKLLVKKLSSLLEPSGSTITWDKQLGNYLKLKNQNEINLICTVAKNLLLEKYHKMVAKEPEMTAKIIAIKTHIKILKTKIN